MAVQTLGNLKRVCILSDLDDAVAEIDRFAPILRDPIKIEDLKGRTTALRESLYHDLENEFYLQVDRAEVRFYDQQMLIGEAVAKKFQRRCVRHPESGQLPGTTAAHGRRSPSHASNGGSTSRSRKKAKGKD
jgi:hypothetical protein